MFRLEYTSFNFCSSNLFHVMSCHVLSYHVLSCHVLSCHVTSCRVGSGRVVLCSSRFHIFVHFISIKIIPVKFIPICVPTCFALRTINFILINVISMKCSYVKFRFTKFISIDFFLSNLSGIQICNYVKFISIKKIAPINQIYSCRIYLMWVLYFLFLGWNLQPPDWFCSHRALNYWHMVSFWACFVWKRVNTNRGM